MTTPAAGGPKLRYTVGFSRDEDGYYIALPWPMRGVWPQLADEAEARRLELASLECIGIEFRDNHVQIQRYRWPWLTEQAAD